jgi:predicted Zn-dependent protease
MRLALSLSLVLAGVAVCPGCRKVEGTGRHQLILTSESAENKMGLQAFQEILQKEKRSTDEEATALLARAGQRLAAAAPQKGFQYQFVLLESKEANAFCLPGGEVCVYSGILPYCRNEAGLATVMGHEIAHAIARHGGERMTQGLIVQGAATGLDAYLQSRGVAPTKSNIVLAAFGAGAQIGVLLPYSRTHEYEADWLGMTYLAKAGYDPSEAEAFWKRFAAQGKSQPPAWLSTHPHSEDRAKEMRRRMPEALSLYGASPKYGQGQPVPARYLQAAK